jgi:hypothetical protein
VLLVAVRENPAAPTEVQVVVVTPNPHLEEVVTKVDILHQKVTPVETEMEGQRPQPVVEVPQLPVVQTSLPQAVLAHNG